MHIFVENRDIHIIVYLLTCLVYLNTINRVLCCKFQNKIRHVPICIPIVNFCESVISLGIMGIENHLSPKMLKEESFQNNIFITPLRKNKSWLKISMT